jgi:hypothetical protein
LGYACPGNSKGASVDPDYRGYRFLSIGKNRDFSLLANIFTHSEALSGRKLTLPQKGSLDSLPFCAMAGIEAPPRCRKMLQEECGAQCRKRLLSARCDVPNSLSLNLNKVERLQML